MIYNNEYNDPYLIKNKSQKLTSLKGTSDYDDPTSRRNTTKQ